MDQSEWARELKSRREAKGLTQMDICRETGAAPAAVYRWEAGKVRPQNRFFKKLRELFEDLPDLPPEAAAEGEGEAARPTGT